MKDLQPRELLGLNAKPEPIGTIYIQPIYIHPQLCPSCGRCPVCGRSGYQYPYQPPYVNPAGPWITCPVTVSL